MRKVCNCVGYLMDKASDFTVFDFAMLKTTLLSVGILLGAFCSRFFRKYQAVLWMISIFSYMYLIYRLFIKDMVFDRD